MISSTVCLNSGLDDIMNKRCPADVNVLYRGNSYEDLEKMREKLLGKIENQVSYEKINTEIAFSSTLVGSEDGSWKFANVDGANEIQHFFKIMIPVCKPIIAVLALWSFVGMWNSYFDAMIYLNDANLQPLQLVLRSILVQNTPQPGMIADIQSTAEMAKIAEQLKYATIVVSSLPLLVMYPFFQKYFDKGIMVGSVKG